MRRFPLISALLMIVVCQVTGAFAATAGIGECPTTYPECLAAWKVERLARLKARDGFLNLAGLYWLRSGASSFGSGEGNDVVFPQAAAAHVGSFDLQDDAVSMSVLPDLDVRIRGQRVSSAVLTDDTSSHPTVVEYRSFAWTVIKRDGQFAIRLRDFDHPALRDFPPIEYYPVDGALRIEAELQRYAEPKIVRVDTVIDGLDYRPFSPGLLHFELQGEHLTLEAYDAGDELLVVFGDTTNRNDTYPAGRFLYVQRPGRDGLTVLDFNTAQNPPCAFNEFATCPIASRGNRLAMNIRAGERYRRSGH